MSLTTLYALFIFDTNAWIMVALIAFVGINIAIFSSRYLRGDHMFGTFFAHLVALLLSLFVMVSTNHLLLLSATFLISNLLLAQLMQHSPAWRASVASKRLSRKYFLVAFLFLVAGSFLLHHASGSWHIHRIIDSRANSDIVIFALLFILLAAFIQSGIMPFHRWLLSSLNSPTPVSGLMHAGLVNGGGFLLIRFAPLYASHQAIMLIIALFGTITLLQGVIWKLMQHDVKRMLACSTIAQMGYMMLQCGLGLFPAAMAHLCFHGLFKCYLFLSSSAVHLERRMDLKYPPTVPQFLLSLLMGCFAVVGFMTFAEYSIRYDTSLFLILMTMVVGAQFSLAIVRALPAIYMPVTAIVTMIVGGIYGATISSVESLMPSYMLAQPLSWVHALLFLIAAACWITYLFKGHLLKAEHPPKWLLHLYMLCLNGSQPDPSTVTSYKNHYQFRG